MTPLLKKLLLRHGSRSRLRAGWLTLCAGMTLLLLSLMAWQNFRSLTQGKGEHDSLGSTFLTISKKVTNENLTESHAFTSEEIADLSRAPQVEDLGALIPATFSAFISIGGELGFSTLLPLEAAPDRFLDRLSGDWRWEPGMTQVPLILSSEFLNQYNFVFAPAQGLPQLSEAAIRALGFRMSIGQGATQEAFTGRITGFSDRIASVLVPESFIQYGNKTHGSGQTSPSRLILKTGDPSDPAFVRYLEDHGYSTNTEQLRWHKLRMLVQAVSIATGILALLLITISALVFVLFAELTLARAQQSIQLLLQLGYRPTYLRRFLFRRFLPLLLSAAGIAMIIAILVQVLFHGYMQLLQVEVGLLPSWPVWLAAGLALTALTIQLRAAVRRGLNTKSAGNQ